MKFILSFTLMFIFINWTRSSWENIKCFLNSVKCFYVIIFLYINSQSYFSFISWDRNLYIHFYVLYNIISSHHPLPSDTYTKDHWFLTRLILQYSQEVFFVSIRTNQTCDFPLKNKPKSISPKKYIISRVTKGYEEIWRILLWKVQRESLLQKVTPIYWIMI